MLATAPFKTRSFRFQWPADLCTAWALEMETLILGWYVLVETGSVGLLTLYGALLLIGTLISPLLGVLGDRLGLRTVLAGMRASYTVFAAAIMLMAFAGLLNAFWVLVIAACSGMIRPTDIGIRSALASATVPREHLVAAMGISRTTQDSARIAGALVGTGVMAAFGMPPVYLVITFLYLSAVLLTLRTDPGITRKAGTSSPWRDLKDGLIYVWRTPRLLAAMCVASLVNLTAFPLSGGLMPYVAREVFQLDQRGLGWLVASFAAGALAGSLSLSAYGARWRAARTMLWACLLWFAFLLVFILSGNVMIAMLMLFGAGFAQSLAMLTLSILLLRTCEPQYQGRIMGVRMLAIYTLPIGLLLVGWLIPKIGYHATLAGLVLIGVVLLAVITWAWRGELWDRGAVANLC